MFGIFLIICPLFIVIFSVAILRRYHVIRENWEPSLNQYVLTIGLPVLVFQSIAQSSISFLDEYELFLYNSIFLLCTFIISYSVGYIFHLSRKMRSTIIVCLMFSNVAYLGIPVLTQTYDHTVLPQISIIVTVYLLWFFSVIIAYLEYIKSSKFSEKVIIALFKNPIIIAAFCGIIVHALHIPIPEIITISLDMITDSVTPVVLVIIGLFIANPQHTTLREWGPVVYFSISTLIIIPTLYYFCLWFFGLTPGQYAISIIESAMPLAITPVAFADRYNLDKNFIVRSIIVSTLLSIITLPFLITFLQ